MGTSTIAEADRARLESARRRVLQARTDHDLARDQLGAEVIRLLGIGVPAAELARVLGITRQGVQEITRRERRKGRA